MRRVRVRDAPAAVEQGWKTYDALAQWIARVDTKASFAFGLHAALLGIVVALTDKGKPIAGISHWWELVTLGLGIAALVIGAVTAALVVAPRLNAKASKTAYRSNHIYFGHLRYWDSKQLEPRLNAKDILPVLARQLVIMSDIAWKKHRLVQVSIWCSFVGGFFVAGTIVLINLG